ncbi:MAG: hypothetical protein E7396_07980 [Ruminococcaceae bacterium]|nr:hypothetical protein [Oscillospiraceae bacterium]
MAIYILSEPYFDTSLWHQKIFNGLTHNLKKKKTDFLCITDISHIKNSGKDYLYLLGTNISWLNEKISTCRALNINPIVLCAASNHDVIKGKYSIVCSDIKRSMNYILKSLSQNGKSRCALYGINSSSILNVTQKEHFLNNKYIKASEEDVFYNKGSLNQCYDEFLKKAKCYDSIISVNDFATVSLFKNLNADAKNYMIAGYGGGFLSREYSSDIMLVSLNYEEFGKAAVSVCDIIRSNKEIETVDVYVKHSVFPEKADDKDIWDFERHPKPSVDDAFYNDEETNRLLKTEKMFQHCDEMDYIILSLMSKDISYEEIAESLFCSLNTVKYRVKKLKESCNCKSKAQLMGLIKFL